MKHFILSVILLVTSITFAQSPVGKRYKAINLKNGHNHTKYTTEPSDLIFKFAAYTTSFDSNDDNNADGKGDTWAIPEWVSYEVQKATFKIEKYHRPQWMTDDNLHKQGIVPNDATYAVSGTRKLNEVKIDYRYVRGHLCNKDAADRISMEAGYNTHTVLNAVPQLQWQNNGIWKALEEKTNHWADEYNSIWVVCGPVFFSQSPAMWLGEADEVKAAIPDALYKIIIRETDTGIKTLSFLFPNIIPKTEKDYRLYLTSMGRLEELTGLKFITNLSIDQQFTIKAKNLGCPTPKKRLRLTSGNNQKKLLTSPCKKTYNPL
ncbi:DNA/RNA non-specific endonuclease [Saccharicrinis fermentans]|uniref:Nuclease n=1 Tax=Saccharicrinis fermentans DSM 9555 = JCM 21142 TaxID=869213 RepID=W7YD29_9BACT|nr:DNA/RNA non-specific endonuclease [Saccharicrinis fermentans]GAF05393.1 nuclease precursor [Saccharicrinis fermentans DSM 9555 = JCM 21142]